MRVKLCDSKWNRARETSRVQEKEKPIDGISAQ